MSDYLPDGATPMALFWKKIEAGKLWRVYDMDGKLLGFVRWGFDGWDGYVVTGKRWPDGDRCVTLRHNKRLFWPIRYAVENALKSRGTTLERLRAEQYEQKAQSE